MRPIYVYQVYGLTSKKGKITVKESDGNPSGLVDTIVFNGTDETVTINGSVAYINGVAPPPNLGGSNLTPNTTLYSGRLSQLNINYKTTDPPGSSVNYISNQSTFTLTTIEAGNGDKGVLTAKINDETVAQINLAANFVESDRDSGQNIANYDVGYNGFDLVDGVCSFSPTCTYSGLGNLQVLSVQPFSSNATYYQVFRARLNITGALRQGYSSIVLEHSEGGSTNVFHYFLDTDTGPDPEIGIVDLKVETPITKWLSGIQFYDAGTVFKASVSGINYCANNVFRNNWLVNFTGLNSVNLYSLDYTDTELVGFSYPPSIGDNNCKVENALFTVQLDKYEYNARLTATVEDPYGNSDSSQSPSYMYMVYSYDIRSTNLAEYFEDENWRHPSTNGDSWPSVNTGQWDSTKNVLLDNDGGLGLQGMEVHAASRELRYPQTNATSYIPPNTADYSSASGYCYYYRWFYSNSSNYNNVNITIPYGDEYEIMIKLPTQTAWADINAPYTGGALDTDGKGCQVSKNGDEYSLTFGGANTGDSGNGFWLRVRTNQIQTHGIPYMIITNWT